MKRSGKNHGDGAGQRIPLTDLHAHILPGLDDGPQTFEHSVALLRRAFDGGTRTIVATPHLFFPLFDYPPEVVHERFRDLQERLADLSLDPEFAFLRELTVCLGAECHASDRFFEAFEDKSVITLNGTRAVLLEFPSEATFEEMKHAARYALNRALIPVLAHFERYRVIREEPSRMNEMARLGCICQINAESLLHHNGKKTARALLESSPTIVIASDAHGAEYRPPNLCEAAARLMRRFPADRVRNWVQTVPSRLLGRSGQDPVDFFA